MKVEHKVSGIQHKIDIVQSSKIIASTTAIALSGIVVTITNSRSLYDGVVPASWAFPDMR